MKPANSNPLPTDTAAEERRADRRIATMTAEFRPQAVARDLMERGFFQSPRARASLRAGVRREHLEARLALHTAILGQLVDHVARRAPAELADDLQRVVQWAEEDLRRQVPKDLLQRVDPLAKRGSHDETEAECETFNVSAIPAARPEDDE